MTLAADIATLRQMDATCREIAERWRAEAKRRGYESNGADPLYQGWCLLDGFALAIHYLEEARKERGE